MLKEVGKVVAVDTDGLWVETIQKSACDQCSARSGCGQRLLADSVMKNMSQIKAYYTPENTRIWSVGDNVEIGLSENALVTAALVVYMLPLMFMVSFAYLGAVLGSGDLGAGLGAMLGLAMGAFFVRWHAYRYRPNRRFQAVILGQAPTLHCS